MVSSHRPEPPGDFAELQQLSDRLATLSTEIDSATEQWMELSELA